MKTNKNRRDRKCKERRKAELRNECKENKVTLTTEDSKEQY